jgi:hypothetical protein
MPAGFKNKKVKPDLSRPSVDLDRTGITREWRDVEVQDLLEGDIVAGMGVVVWLQPTCDGEMVIEAGLPETVTYYITSPAKVLAFVKKES